MLRYPQVHATPDGESHFEDVDVAFTTGDYAPPAPPLHVSACTPTAQSVFVVAASGWRGDWHPTSTRLWAVILAGALELAVSDGEVRHVDQGSVLLLEDRTGRGHETRVLGSGDALIAFVHLPG